MAKINKIGGEILLKVEIKMIIYKIMELIF